MFKMRERPWTDPKQERFVRGWDKDRLRLAFVTAAEMNGQEATERIEYPPEAFVGESQTTRKGLRGRWREQKE
jgi:hypothetical protein